MGKWKVIEPQTGQTLVLTGDTPPTKEKLDTVFTNYRAMKRIASYSDESQLSAHEARNRGNMWDVLGGTIRTAQANADPKNEMPVGERFVRAFQDPFKIGLAGVGAVGQSISGLASSIPVGMQRVLKPGSLATPESTLATYNEMGDIMKRSVTGKEPTEFGDIATNLGAGPITAAVSGLAMDAVTPGPAQIAKSANLVRQAALTGAQAFGKNVVKGAGRLLLPNVSRVPAKAAKYGLDTGFAALKPGESIDDIADNLDDAVLKVKKAADWLQKKASKLQDDVMQKHAATHVDIGDALIKPRKEMLTSGLYSTGADGLPIIGLDGKPMINPDVKGNQELHDIMYRIYGTLKQNFNSTRKMSLTVGQIREFTKSLKSLASNPDFGSVQKFAAQLKAGLTDAAAEQVPEFGEANKMYGLAMKALEGDEKLGTVGVNALTDVSKTGNAAVDKYFTMPQRGQRALTTLEGMVPEEQKFLKPLKDAALGQEFSSYKPNSTLSAMGIGFTLSRLANIPYVGAALGLSSKRLSGMAYKYLLSGIKGEAWEASPVLKAFGDLVNNGVINPAIVTGARQEALKNYQGRQETSELPNM